jgi:hypothetical protein
VSRSTPTTHLPASREHTRHTRAIFSERARR